MIAMFVWFGRHLPVEGQQHPSQAGPGEGEGHQGGDDPFRHAPHRGQGFVGGQ